MDPIVCMTRTNNGRETPAGLVARQAWITLSTPSAQTESEGAWGRAPGNVLLYLMTCSLLPFGIFCSRQLTPTPTTVFNPSNFSPSFFTILNTFD